MTSNDLANLKEIMIQLKAILDRQLTGINEIKGEIKSCQM